MGRRRDREASGPASASGAVHPDPRIGQGAAGVGNGGPVACWTLQMHEAASFTWNLVGHCAARLDLSQDRGGLTLFMVVDVERDLPRICDCHEDAIGATRGWRGRDGRGSRCAVETREDKGGAGDDSDAHGALVTGDRTTLDATDCCGRLVEGGWGRG